MNELVINSKFCNQTFTFIVFAVQLDPAQLMRGMYSIVRINAQRRTLIRAKLAKDYTSDAKDHKAATDADSAEHTKN